MGKIGLIITREYLTRVKKRTFILMTLLGPLLFAGAFVAIALMSTQEKDLYKVAVLDDSYVLSQRMAPMSKKIEFNTINESSFQQALIKFKTEDNYKDYDYLLWIPPTLIKTYKGTGKVVYRKAPSMKIEGMIKESVRLARESFILDKKFEGDSAKKTQFREEYEDIRSLSEFTLIDIDNVDETGERIEDDINVKAGAFAGLGFSSLIFMFIFFFGSQIMRGVIEEKSNRIIEVIISSIKPFQLMMGKIIGVALVGLTQFVIWGVLTFILIGVVLPMFMPELSSPDQVSQMSEGMLNNQADLMKIQNQTISAISTLPWENIIPAFFFFFLMGYLIYGALFAAVGAAVDNETDSQQFMLPVSTPLTIGFYVVYTSALMNPDAPALFWLSLFPLTSPVVMLSRIAMGSAELWEVILSMVLLVVTFIGVVWMAGKIYRTGILMYGKKPSYKEIFKWLKY